MTRFAAPDVLQCPQCNSFVLWARLMSFNNFGFTTQWSDGAGPLARMRDSCSAICCPACGDVLWRDDLQMVGVLAPEPPPLGRLSRIFASWSGDKQGHLRAEREWREQPASWKVAECGRPINYSDIQRALLVMQPSHDERELFLRRRMWWAMNDHLRLRQDGSRVSEVPVAPESARQANMLRMIEIHEAAGSAVVERAELLRQLGRFDDVVRLLTSRDPEAGDNANAASILKWAKAQNANVKIFS